jgi:hypothetical protein
MSKLLVGSATIAMAVAGLLVSAAGPANATTAPVHVDGIYRVHSTDCYFAAGTCTARFDIEQNGLILFDTGDKLFHGRIRYNHITIGETYPQGTIEDSWSASGTTTNGGRSFSGTFSDGIGGSGTFTATFLAAG